MVKKVSVIVPVYNAEKHIRRCIDSVLAQSCTDYELIIVDDGSSDNSPRICDEYSEKHENISVIHKENGGVSSARNVGIINSCGEYLMFIDSDDFIVKDTIEKLLDFWVSNDLDFVIGGYTKYYGDSPKISIKCDKRILSPEEIFDMVVTKDDVICVPWGKLFKKSLFNSIKFDESTNFAEDMLIFYRLLEESKKIGYDSNIYYFYSQESNSLVRSPYLKQKLKRIEAAEEWVEFSCNRFPSLYEKTRAYYLNIIVDEFSKLLFWDNELASKKIIEFRKIILDNHVFINTSLYIKRKNKLKVFLIRNKLFLLYKMILKVKGNAEL